MDLASFFEDREPHLAVMLACACREVLYILCYGSRAEHSDRYDHSANPMEPYIQVAVQPFETVADLHRVLF